MAILYFVILGPGTQSSTVEISGVDVNEAITFTAHGTQSQGLPSFIIINDTVALETIEQYGLFLSSPSITNGNTLGPGTAIYIIDDDGKSFMEWVITMKYFHICVSQLLQSILVKAYIHTVRIME